MSLFNLFDEEEMKTKNKDSLLDLLLLNELEEEEVEKGNTGLENFSEEEFEDDDYYNEDVD